MEKSILFFLSIALAIAIIPSDACMNISSMDIAGSCHQASTSTRMYDLCMKTMNGVKDNSEILTYAVTAASVAARSFEFTVAMGDNLINNPSTPGEMKAAYEVCMRRYSKARKLVDGVVGELQGCFFDHVEDECMDAIVAIDDCATAVMLVNSSGAATPFHTIVLDNRDRAVLALRLINLFH
jgi:pectinesterase inhibitor-like protein